MNRTTEKNAATSNAFTSKSRKMQSNQTMIKATSKLSTRGFANKLIMMMLLVSLMVLSACTSTKETTTDNTAELKKRGYLIMGLDDTFAPMGFRDENNELTGFDVELAKAVGEKLGLEIKFQPIDWSMKETELDSKNIDMIWNGYTITVERKQKVNFSIPYLKNRQVIVVMNGSQIQDKAGLADKSIAVQRQSSALDAVTKDTTLLNAIKGKAPIEFDTNLEVFMDLESGRVDAIVVDEILADYLIQQRGPENYRYLKEDMGAEEYGIGLRLTDLQLLDDINTTLQTMMNDGTFNEIKVRWFGEEQ